MIGYETVFITHPDLEEADLKKSLKKFKDIIKKGKGKLVHEYLWADDAWHIKLPTRIMVSITSGIYKVLVRSSTNSKPSSDTATKYSVFKR